MPDTPLTIFGIAVLLFGVALLYSSVGHAGGSGYLAVMALVGIAPAIMRPTALTLNILVAGIASVKFYRAGCFRWPLFWPFAITSVPAAFIGGMLTLPSQTYQVVVGLVLLYSAARLFLTARKPTGADRAPLLVVAMAAGLGIGLLAGLVGVGGGIFLTPLLLFMRWAETRIAAGVSAVFILVNSVAGLLGQAASVANLTPAIGVWAIAAAIGGWIGATNGSRRLATPTLRELLAAVLVVAGLKMILV